METYSDFDSESESDVKYFASRIHDDEHHGYDQNNQYPHQSPSAADDKSVMTPQIEVDLDTDFVEQEHSEPRSRSRSCTHYSYSDADEDVKPDICSCNMVTVLNKENDFKPFFDIGEEQHVVENGDFAVASEVSILTKCDVTVTVSSMRNAKSKKDVNNVIVKPILENGDMIACKDGPFSLFPHEDVYKPCLKQEHSESNNVVKTEPQFGLCRNVENVVKEESEVGKTKVKGQVGDGKEKNTELMLGEDNVTEAGEMQLQISNVRSLNDSSDIAPWDLEWTVTAEPGGESHILEENLMMTDARGNATVLIMDADTESSSTSSGTKGVLSSQPCPRVTSHPATDSNSRLGKHGQLQRHRGADALDKPYKCELCGVGFADRDNLQKHERIHTGGETRYHKCKVCGDTFTLKSILKMHKKTHTGEKPYMCEVCDTEFALRSTLQIHKRIHTGERPYKCEVCGAGFTAKGTLRRHNRIHTRGELLYKCEVCGAGFMRKGTLQIHKMVHTGERPNNKCKVYDVGFAHSKLQLHKRTHTGEKPYKCEVCGDMFTQESNLKMHQRTHTGEKSYKCEVCEAGFSDRSDLRRHKIIHTLETFYKCEICGAGFTQKVCLQRHKRLHT